MGFMSLVFIGIYLIIMIAGAINLLIAAIIFLVRFIKKRKNKKVGRVSKVVAIIFLIMGTLAEIPLIIGIVQMGVQEIEDKHYYENLENKVFVQADRLEDEFEYNGETLVTVADELENDSLWGEDERKTEFTANLIFNNSDEDYYYTEMRKTENTSGYDIYMIHDSIDMYYVKKEDKEKVVEYYRSRTEYTAEVQRGSGEWVDLEIDLQRLRDIVANSKTEEKRGSQEKRIYYDLEINSADYIWGASYSFAFFGDGILFEPGDTDTVTEGYVLSKEDEAYIRDVFEKAIADSHS